MVMKNTSASSASIIGKPSTRLVSTLSICLSRLSESGPENTAPRHISAASLERYSGLVLSGFGGCRPSFSAFSIAGSSCSGPSLLLADMPVTGTPSRSEMRGRFRLIPLRSASSMRLAQSITLSVSAIICRARLRLRSIQVASQTTTMRSAAPERMKSRAASSSAERAIRE